MSGALPELLQGLVAQRLPDRFPAPGLELLDRCARPVAQRARFADRRGFDQVERALRARIAVGVGDPRLGRRCRAGQLARLRRSPRRPARSRGTAARGRAGGRAAATGCSRGGRRTADDISLRRRAHEAGSAFARSSGPSPSSRASSWSSVTGARAKSITVLHRIGLRIAEAQAELVGEIAEFGRRARSHGGRRKRSAGLRRARRCPRRPAPGDRAGRSAVRRRRCAGRARPAVASTRSTAAACAVSRALGVGRGKAAARDGWITVAACRIFAPRGQPK